LKNIERLAIALNEDKIRASFSSFFLIGITPKRCYGDDRKIVTILRESPGWLTIIKYKIAITRARKFIKIVVRPVTRPILRPGDRELTLEILECRRFAPPPRRYRPAV